MFRDEKVVLFANYLCDGGNLDETAHLEGMIVRDTREGRTLKREMIRPAPSCWKRVMHTGKLKL